MNWTDLTSAFALVLVVEGLWPFLSPKGFKQRIAQILQVPSEVLRYLGLASMLLGLLVLYLVRV